MMVTVFIVEDELKIRNSIRDFVEREVSGFKVIGEASDGAEAIECLEREAPDLLITDIRMKGMDGLELIERIHQSCPEMTILIISAHGEFEYAQKALRFGADDYLLKPINRMQLTLFLNKVRDGKSPLASSEDTENAKQERLVIRTIKQRVAERLHEPITLQAIAQEVHMNHRYLSTLFKAETGINFSDYIERCRMDKAKKLLKESKLKIYEIAGLCGYASAKHFMVIFKQAVGCTPTDYRDRTERQNGEDYEPFQ